MAVEVKKSTAITNRDSNLLTDSALAGAFLKEIIGLGSLLTTDSVGSTYKIGEIPSNARLSQLLLSCTAAGATGTIDIGLYRTTKDGGAAVDADLFASAAAITSALNDSNVARESGTLSVANSEKTIWQLLGLSEDPNLVYDLVATLTQVVESNATIAVKAHYVQ